MGWRTDFREYLKSGGRSPNTVAAYCRDVDLFAIWFEDINKDPFVPELLNSVDVREWRMHSLDEEHISGPTWNRRMASLKVFSDWSLAMGYAKGDPLAGVRPVKLDISILTPLWLDPQEYRRLRRQLEIDVNAANTGERQRLALRDRALVWLMLGAGLRVGEAVKVRACELLLKKRSGWVRIPHGKGDKAARMELGREARIALRDWLAACSPSQDLLFDGVTTRQVQRRTAELGIRAGLADPLTPHRLRHTFVRRLAVTDSGNANYPEGWVQDMARHSRAVTTRRYYQASADDRQRMVECL